MTKILAALLLAGCVTASQKAAKIEYGRDPRTGLCFAMYYNGEGTSLTTVPCTPDVLRLVR